MLAFSNNSLANYLFWVSRKKWLIITFFISVILFYLPTPEGLSSEGHRTLIIVITTLILIISESIPLPAVAILILIMEVTLGVDSPDGVAASFMSDAVFFIMGSLMLAVYFWFCNSIRFNVIFYWRTHSCCNDATCCISANQKCWFRYN